MTSTSDRARSASLSVPTAISVILGLLAASSLAAQIVIASIRTTTTLETSLFSVLQFVFSIAFAWILTRVAAKKEFVESQKAFAIAAYRRINEIDEGVERLIARTTIQRRSASPDTLHELEVLAAIARGVRASIKSSIADWGDVIGDELTTISTIERIKAEQQTLLQAPEPTDSTHQSEADRALKAERDRSKSEIMQLLSTLPPSLRLIAENERRREDPVSQHCGRLADEHRQTGTITLRAFWEAPLERDVRTMKVGDSLQLHIGTTVGERLLAVCARDTEGKPVGIVTNNGRFPYYVFRESLVEYLQSTAFEAEILGIDPEDGRKRHYFTVQLKPSAFEARERFYRARVEVRRKRRIRE